MYESIKKLIMNKKKDIDDQTLTYFTNYFYVVMQKKVIPKGISLENLIDNALLFAQKVVFYDEKDSIYKHLGPDVKGLRDPDTKTIFIRNNLDEPLREMVIYHEIHHAVQTNKENNEVGINQESNIGRMIMEAQTQWFAEEVYKEVHKVEFEEREIPSEELRMLGGGIVVSALHNYEMYDSILSKLAIILDVSKSFFVSINYLYDDNKGLKILEERYKEKAQEKGIDISFEDLLFWIDYIYVVDFLAYKENPNKQKILDGGETQEYQIHGEQRGGSLSLAKERKYMKKFDLNLLLPLIEKGIDFEEFGKYVFDNNDREIIKPLLHDKHK